MNIRFSLVTILVLVSCLIGSMAYPDDQEPPLISAAGTGDVVRAKVLLAEGADVNVRNKAGESPLHKAAIQGHNEIVMLLIDNKADVNAQDKDGKSPLRGAAWAGHTNVVETLLAHGGDVNVPTTSGLTPLHSAAANGRKNIVDLLLAHGADVNAMTTNGLTPLHSAALMNSKDVVEVLLAHGANVNAQADGFTPLFLAVHKGYKEVVKMLLAHGADVNSSANTLTPLSGAAANGDKDMVELLLANHAEVDASAVVSAAMAGRITIAKMLNPQLGGLLSDALNNRTAWPKEVVLKEKLPFPIVIAGKEVGHAELPAGSKVGFVGVQGEQVKVILNDHEQVIPMANTDFGERVLQKISDTLRAKVQEIQQKEAQERLAAKDKATDKVYYERVKKNYYLGADGPALQR